MATGPHAVVAKDKPVTFEESPEPAGDDEEDSPQHEFYESGKILGKLFRAIDEREVFSSIQEGSSHMNGSQKSRHSILGVVWAYIQQHCQAFEWKHHITRACALLDEYVKLLT